MKYYICSKISWSPQVRSEILFHFSAFETFLTPKSKDELTRLRFQSNFKRTASQKVFTNIELCLGTVLNWYSQTFLVFFHGILSKVNLILIPNNQTWCLSLEGKVSNRQAHNSLSFSWDFKHLQGKMEKTTCMWSYKILVRTTQIIFCRPGGSIFL